MSRAGGEGEEDAAYSNTHIYIYSYSYSYIYIFIYAAYRESCGGAVDEGVEGLDAAVGRLQVAQLRLTVQAHGQIKKRSS
jgi:hypothetical protein